MSDVATPVIENAETLGEEAPRIAQRRASAKAREDDRKAWLEGKGEDPSLSDKKGFWSGSVVSDEQSPAHSATSSPAADHDPAKKSLA